MRIHVTYTGGTIGMLSTPHGLAPGADVEGWLKGILFKNPLGQIQMSFTQLDPLIDSSCATPENWQAIIDDIRLNDASADAFIVLHGTDTMAYTASALSYALAATDKPVVLTGSQLPLGAPDTDAVANVVGAFEAVLSKRAQGVTLFFGNRLFLGTRVTKTSSWAFDAFSAPSLAPETLECVSEFRLMRQANTEWNNPKPYTRHNVVVVDMVPGITALRLEAMLTPLPEAVIMRSYGAGNIPSTEPGLVDVLLRVMRENIPVVIASQCQQAVVEVGKYQVSDALGSAGAIGAADMTLEALYAKLLFLLSQGLQGHELAKWIAKPLAGELTIKDAD